MARVIFCVPPINNSKGQAQATGNRQYQYFKDHTYIYPIIPSIFVSMLITEPNQQCLFVDSIAEKLDQLEFGKILVDMKPDYLIFEANTMVCKRYWQTINDIKKNIPEIKIILTGEHYTACPEETKQNCQADHFISGGKWYYEAFKIIVGKEWSGVGEVKPLPHINRMVSRWWNYAYNNGNYKHTPATYTMAAQDCWYRPTHKEGTTAACTFCTWVDYHPENAIRPVEDFLLEVESLINFGFKEFFDDSGTFPVGKWLHEFCNEMIDRGYNQHIKWGCNMRFKALKPEDFKLMAKAGCRFILWGFESANQKTLDKLSKGYNVSEVSPNLIHARMNGIWNHLTVMMGYPWETLEEENRTYKMVKYLLLNDWAASMQSTIFMPYPGTTAFKQLKQEGLILTEDWDKWDMTNEVVKLQYPFKQALELQKKYYQISYHPKFLFNKLKNIKSTEDIKQYYRLSKKVFNRFGNIINDRETAFA